MRIYELVIDEEQDIYGVDAISLVDEPAIETDFIALKRQYTFKQAADRQVLIGPALIPDKMIYRKDDNGEFSIYFSKNTVRRASELYLTRGLSNSFTKDHESEVSNVHLVESWIVESEQDKSRQYGFNVPLGTWMVAVKVTDTTLWAEAVKTGDVKGFSIEGYFINSMEKTKEEEAMAELEGLFKRMARS